MTKQEYKNLLESDYWKGFSFSIIKERNFTCEDCGAYYPGERNKLQVHHLVYRDINPWSYAPNEMVVLCRSCHEKRHGIIHPQEDLLDDVEKLSDQDAVSLDKIKHYFVLLGRKIINVCGKKNYMPNHWGYRRKRRWKGRQKFHIWLFFIALLLVYGCVCLFVSKRNAKHSESSKNDYYESLEKTTSKESKHKKKKSKKIKTEAEVDPFQEVEEPEDVEPEIIEEPNMESNDVPITPNSANEEPSIE